LLSQAGEDLTAQAAIPDPGPDLEQFMSGQGGIHLPRDRLRQALLADEHDRLQAVAEAPKVLFLVLGEVHGGKYRAGRGRRVPSAGLALRQRAPRCVAITGRSV